MPTVEITKAEFITLAEMERQAIEHRLACFQGNRTHASKSLGISDRTLQRKLKAWGIQDRKAGDTDLTIKRHHQSEIVSDLPVAAVERDNSP